jgi:hypothetical protein
MLSAPPQPCIPVSSPAPSSPSGIHIPATAWA